MDLRTLILMAALSSIMLAAVIYIVSRVVRDNDATDWWVRGLAATSVGYLLIVLRGMVPDFFSIVAANVLLGWGWLHFFIGFRRYFGLPTAIRWDIAAAVVVAASFVPLTYVWPEVRYRVAIVSTILALATLGGAAVAAKHARPDLTLLRGYLAVVLAATGGLFLFRAVAALLSATGGDLLNAYGLVPQLTFAWASVAHIALAGGLPLLLMATARKALAESEANYRELVDNVNAIILRMAPDGTITYFNDYAERFFGYRADEILGRHVVGTIVPATESNSGRDLSAMISDILTDPQQFADNENENMTRDGRRVTVRWANRVILDANRRPSGVLSIGTDITSRKRAEAELARHRDRLEEEVAKRTVELVAAKEAAESANRAKSAFLANMSHELRTPMHGVMGMIDLAKRCMTDPKGLDRLNTARRSAERLLGVLNDILDISKIEAERLILEDQPLQLAETTDNLLATLGQKAADKGLGLTLDLPAELARRPLRGDPLRLGQILTNLIGNAIKFTERGEVVLRIRAVEETAEAVAARFEIVDTGIGIDAEAQTRLFQSFEQADNSMTRKYGGTGLGLAICKRLVELMGGEIGVDSVVGQGSVFRFVVPLKKREPAAVAPAPSSDRLAAEQRLHAAHAGKRLLVAEDEPVTREVARSLLEDIGLVADVAENGRQALALARANAYALILMDMQMPSMNGLEATRSIRADSLNRTTPILAMTANAFDEDRQACLAAGMNEHIAKPFDRDKLYDRLLEWLEKRDGRSAA